MIDENSIFMINDKFRFQWEPTQNNFVLLYSEGMIKLNSTSGEILQLCDGKHTVATLISELENKFPDQEIAADIKNFLGDAHGKGWIQPQ